MSNEIIKNKKQVGIPQFKNFIVFRKLKALVEYKFFDEDI